MNHMQMCEALSLGLSEVLPLVPEHVSVRVIYGGGSNKIGIFPTVLPNHTRAVIAAQECVV